MPLSSLLELMFDYVDEWGTCDISLFGEVAALKLALSLYHLIVEKN